MSKRYWTDEEIELYRTTHSRFFYFNREDLNILVPKAFGIGRTLNWAHPVSWVVALALIGLIIFSIIRRSG